jgi:hypothetical protein
MVLITSMGRVNLVSNSLSKSRAHCKRAALSELYIGLFAPDFKPKMQPPLKNREAAEWQG